jgi:flagellar FliL protein
VLGGGGGAAFLLMQPKSAAAEEGGGHGAEKAEKKGGGHGAEKKSGGHGGGGAEGEANPALGTIAEGPDGVTFYTMPDMVMNIQTADGRPTFLKLKLTLEMQDARLAAEMRAEEMPRMQDMFQTFLRELRPEDLAGSPGFQLRAEILRRVNLVIAPTKANAVLIEEMLINRAP